MHKELPKFFIFLDQYNSDIFKNKNTKIGVIYRNYNDKNKDREKELTKIAQSCKKCRFQLFISNDIRLVYKFKANGLYIPSFNKTKKYLNLEKKNISILGSVHNQKEIYEKKIQKCKAVFLSPLFHTKKSNKFLGIYKFNSIVYSNKIDIFALGGISIHNIKKIKSLSILGFGGIDLFKKKPAYKRPVFIKNNFF